MNNSTIQDVIKQGLDKNLSHYNLQMKDYVTNNRNGMRLVISNLNLIDKYYHNLIDHLEEVELTDKELEKYRHRPDLFCLDNYGTLELWGTLLRFNNIFTRAEFDKKKIKIFKLSFIDVLNEILILEGDNIDSNIAYVNKL